MLHPAFDATLNPGSIGWMPVPWGLLKNKVLSQRPPERRVLIFFPVFVISWHGKIEKLPRPWPDSMFMSSTAPAVFALIYFNQNRSVCRFLTCSTKPSEPIRIRAASTTGCGPRSMARIHLQRCKNSRKLSSDFFLLFEEFIVQKNLKATAPEKLPAHEGVYQPQPLRTIRLTHPPHRIYNKKLLPKQKRRTLPPTCAALGEDHVDISHDQYHWP